MDENDREFLKQIADALDRPRTRSTSPFVESMTSGGEGTPCESSERVARNVTLLALNAVSLLA